MGGEENRRTLFTFLADVFEKNEKKNKTTSVYRLNRGGRSIEISVPILFLKLFRDFDYWPLNGGSTVYRVG